MHGDANLTSEPPLLLLDEPDAHLMQTIRHATPICRRPCCRAFTHSKCAATLEEDCIYIPVSMQLSMTVEQRYIAEVCVKETCLVPNWNAEYGSQAAMRWLGRDTPHGVAYLRPRAWAERARCTGADRSCLRPSSHDIAFAFITFTRFRSRTLSRAGQ